jgi:phenylalanyl-tRNA synthetase beta chain
MLPGLLKSLSSNRASGVRDGLKLFEISDVMLLDASSDVGARNERHLAALYTGPTAGFEVIHGLVDRVMMLLEVPVRPYSWAVPAGGAGGSGGAADGGGAAGGSVSGPFGRFGKRYYIEAAECPSYFPGRGAQVVLEKADGSKVVVGSLGVLHPKVLAAFELAYPVSVLEINIEHFV